MAANVEKLCKTFSALESTRAQWDSFIQEISEVVCPRKAYINEKQTTPDGEKEGQLYNTTAIQCNQTLAHGQLSYAMPFSERWFASEPPLDMTSDGSRRWYAKCGEIMAQGLATSSFYTHAHEACIDRGGFGTGVIFCEESLESKSGLFFCVPQAGSYCIVENAEGFVDTFYWKRELTADQIAGQFGEDKLPEKVRKDFENPEKRYTTKHKVVHAVYPRKDRDYTSFKAANKEFASCYFMPETKTLLRESGYDSFPYLTSRYLKWGDEPYGWCPGWQALPAARQLNLLEKLMDTMAEVALYPRMLIPSTLAGNVALGAGGVTIYNPFQNAKPETWGYEGQYEPGVERLQRREQEIKDAYHYDLFRMFEQIDKQMTAREVAERATEKLVLFSPTFVRMQEEWLQPLLHRVFSIYLKQGRFPEPPPEVIAEDQAGPHIRPPRITFTSRIALAIRSLQSSGFMNLLETLQPMMAVDPSVRHIIKPHEAGVGIARNFGVPEEWLSTQEEYQGAIQAEQQAMAAQQEMAMMKDGAQAVGSLKPEQIDGVAKALGAA